MQTRFDRKGKLCFGLFHHHERFPLVFIETSLVDRLAKRIEPLLQCDADWHDSNKRAPTHAIFYAIIATQPC